MPKDVIFTCKNYTGKIFMRVSNFVVSATPVFMRVCAQVTLLSIYNKTINSSKSLLYQCAFVSKRNTYKSGLGIYIVFKQIDAGVTSRQAQYPCGFFQPQNLKSVLKFCQ